LSIQEKLQLLSLERIELDGGIPQPVLLWACLLSSKGRESSLIYGLESFYPLLKLEKAQKIPFKQGGISSLS